MEKFRVKRGRHLSGGRVYKEGDVVKSNAPLHKLFREKFERLGKVAPETSEKEKGTPGGKDVTDEFEGAEEVGIKVFKDGKKFNVFIDGEDDAIASQVTKKKVNETIAEYYEAEDEEA